MQKNHPIYDSIDDIIGFLNETNRCFKDQKEPDLPKSINEKNLIEEQYDSLSEFQINFEDETKKKKDQFQVIQTTNENFQNNNENFQKYITPNDSFMNPNCNV